MVLVGCGKDNFLFLAAGLSAAEDMPPKVVPKFPITEDQLIDVRYQIPYLRDLSEEFHTPLAELIKLMKTHGTKVVKFVDRICWELHIAPQRLQLARLEHIMSAFIQTEHNPNDIISHVLTVVESPDDAFLTPFKSMAEVMVQLRETWQGKAASEDTDDEDEKT